MALPKLNNDQPTYEMVVPSTKSKVKYRPFLVKEQKNLLIAMESKDSKQILNTMLACLESCVEGVNANDLATFDVDYMFTQVRAKSVGETSSIVTKCGKCEHDNTVTIDLTDIKMEANVKDTVIKLTDEISVKMKFPTYKDIMVNDTIFGEDVRAIDVMLETVIASMHSIQTPDENFILKDEPREEIENFMNSLTNDQLEKINEFVQAMPTLSHEKEYTCEACGQSNVLELRGFQDFF